MASNRKKYSLCSSSLDVMRVDSGDGRTQHSVCYAAYGYMGDLLRCSERLRWLGPVRYALAGAITFLRGRSYTARISFVPAPPPGYAFHPLAFFSAAHNMPHADGQIVAYLLVGMIATLAGQHWHGSTACAWHALVIHSA